MAFLEGWVLAQEWDLEGVALYSETVPSFYSTPSLWAKQMTPWIVARQRAHTFVEDMEHQN